MILVIKKIVEKLDSDKKVLVENFLSLSIIQGLNYILPLITLPYLVRVLGPEKFGLIAFAQAFIQYFNILTDYGFNLSATKEISIYREDKKKVSEIFSSVMIIKLILMVFSFALLTIITFYFRKFRTDWEIYFLTFGMVIGHVLFPVWFFQGIEKMKYITIFNTLAKIVFTASIFLLVREPSDYFLVPILNSLGFIIVGIASIFLIRKSFNVRMIFPEKTIILNIFKEASVFFAIRLSTTIYTNSGTFLVGVFQGNMEAAYYSVAEKVVRVLQWIMQPVFQAIFPYVSKLFQQSRKKAFSFVKKVAFVIGAFSLILSLVIFLFSDRLILFLFNKEFLFASSILKILSFLPLIGNLTHIFGVETLQASGHQKVFFKVACLGSLFYLVLSPIGAYIFGAKGVASALLIVETIVLLLTIMYVHKYYR